ncbi:MAG: AAA domain-containing protein [Bacteroidetes bacterium]|nr:AAA domain-containing protein [Bacteroidota bacterium]
MSCEMYYTEIQDLIENKLHPKERISLLRRILDQLFKELTKHYEVNISGLQPRMAFYCQQEKVSSTMQASINELRVFCNLVVHDEIPEPSDNNQKQCVKILTEFLSVICKSEIPTGLKSYYESETSFFPLIKRKIRKYEDISEIQGIIKSFSKEIKQDKFNKGFIDIIIDNDNLGTISVRLTQSDDQDIIVDILKSAWEFAEIIITDLLFDKQNGYYYSTLKTLVILEPNYIIDVKQIAECNEFLGYGDWGVNPNVYQKKKFEEVRINEHIIKGYLLGSILDEIASNTPFDFSKKADEYFKSNAISSLAIRKVNGNEIIDRIKIETQPQEQNIRNALSRFTDHKASIEPTFLSIKYGIQGRLDALYENSTNSNDKTVIELKSGNPSYSNPQHQTQTALYDLLLKSTYAGRIGNSYILYSRLSPNPLKLLNIDNATIVRIQRKAMMIRNKIVSDEFKIAAGEMKPIYDAIDEIQLSSIEKSYFEGFCKFISNELKAAKEKYRNTLLSTGDHNSSSKYLSNLEIISISEDFEIILNINPDNELLFDLPDFKENDYIMMFPIEPDGTTNPLNHQILKSVIKEINDDRLTICLINKQLSKVHFDQYPRWAICQDLRESTIKRMYQQVYSLITSSNEKKKLLLSVETIPSFSEVEYKDALRLTPFQNQVVRKAISANNYFIIQGPPGTGKTKYVLTEIVKNIHRNEKVVVIAYTNQAVSEICTELLELKIDFLQLGGKSDKPYFLSSYANSLRLNDLITKIENTNVIVSTQHTLVTNFDLLNSIKYRTIIVDEASQLLEPQIIGILIKFDRFILIGDEKQLPAISLQEEDENNIKAELIDISLLRFNESLFYRLILNAKKKKWNCFETLIEQGRMHNDIADFPNKYYYENQLKPISKEQQSEAQIFSINSDSPLERCLALKRVIFIPSEKEKIPFQNDYERDLIKNFLQTIIQVCKAKNIQIVLKAKSENEISIGIITSFRKQISNIKRIIPQYLKQIILVDTIEKFQGSERDIIFYSAAVNKKQQIEKLQSILKIDNIEVDRKLNVVLTRAKKHLIITGTRSVLENNKHYTNLIEDINTKGGLLRL